MIRNIIIFILATTTLWSIYFISFFHKKQTSNIIGYNWTIQQWPNIIYHNFSWTQQSYNYNINHNISLKKKDKELINILVNQYTISWSQKIILKDYKITTGQWNYRIEIFEKEILSPYKNKEIFSIDNNTWIQYTIKNTQSLLQDTITIQGHHLNHINQKNYYSISIRIYCGILQYFKKTSTCSITWDITLDLPINSYKKERKIKWILTKK